MQSLPITNLLMHLITSAALELCADANFQNGGHLPDQRLTLKCSLREDPLDFGQVGLSDDFGSMPESMRRLSGGKL